MTGKERSMATVGVGGRVHWALGLLLTVFALGLGANCPGWR